MSLPVMTIEGDVVAVHSHWTNDESRIVTEATIRTPDGSQVVVSQLGGSADGLGMITMPGPPILEAGMTVALAAHRDLDLAQTEHIVVDSVKISAYPPSYVRSGPTKAGHPLYWESGCVFVTLDSAGTTALPKDQTFSIIDASIATWNDDTATCSYMKVKDAGKQSLEVGNDHVNLIKFRDTTWGRPAVDGDAPRSYAAAAAGITTATYVDDGGPRDGAIVDADIEINGVNFAISAGGQTSTRACPPAIRSGSTRTATRCPRAAWSPPAARSPRPRCTRSRTAARSRRRRWRPTTSSPCAASTRRARIPRPAHRSRSTPPGVAARGQRTPRRACSWQGRSSCGSGAASRRGGR